MNTLLRKIYIALLFIGLSTSHLLSQGVELSAFTGYSFANGFSIRGGDGDISGGHTFGLSVGVPILNQMAIEAMFTSQQADLTVSSTFLNEDFGADVTVNYYMIGVNRILAETDPFEFYTSIKIGAVSVIADNDEFETDTRFAVGMSVGGKLYLADNFGLKTGVEIGFPIIETGSSIGWSPGNGGSVGFSTWSPIVRFNFQAGVFFKLGS